MVRIINPKRAESQMEGAMEQGIGYSIWGVGVRKWYGSQPNFVGYEICTLLGVQKGGKGGGKEECQLKIKRKALHQ